MRLIPVVDLMQGQVVRGERGQRHRYRPIVSALCASSDPTTVGQRLCQHCDSDALYVADLDAIQGRGLQVQALRALAAVRPGLALWLDAGFADAAAAQQVAQQLQLEAIGARLVPVFGTESLASLQALRGLPPQAVLSLDQRGGQPMDPAGAWDHPQDWPQQVIVMTLDRVGAGSGPDLDELDRVRALAPQAELIGAGGVRDEADLQRAARAGAHAWLVASALHDGRIPPQAPLPAG